MDGVNIKDMSESEPEPEVQELPNPKSSFVIPKVPRKAKPKKKSAQPKPKGENVFITNPALGDMSDYSDDADHQNDNSKIKDKKKSAIKSLNKNNDDEYEEDYENEFEEDNHSKQKDNSQDEYDQENFEKDSKIYKSQKKGGIEENKIKSDTSKANLNRSLNKSQHRVSSINKPSIGSRFNTRVSTSNQVSNPRKKILNQAPSRYNNLNKSSTADRKSRPNTYGKNRSQLNLSHHVTSSTNIKSNNISLTKNKLSGSKSRRDHSEKKIISKPTKEQEILITKTYDLILNIGNKSNHKKISYVNKDEKESVFTVKSSHPDQLAFKNDEITVGAGDKAKFSLKFKQVNEPRLAQYVLFLTKDGQPHENILLNVKYE